MPVIALVRTAYAYVLHEQGRLVRLALPWIAIAYAVGLLGNLLGGASIRVGWTAAGIINWFGYSAVAVAWLRHLVLGEPWPRWMAPVTPFVLRFMFATVLLVLLVAVPTALVAALLSLVLGALLGPQAGGSAALVLALGLGLWAYVHLIFLPFSRAVGERLDLAACYRLVKGRALPLLFGFLLAVLPLMLVAALGASMLAALLPLAEGEARLPSEGGPPSPGGVLVDLLMLAASYADAAITASFLAGAYVQLIRPGDPPPPARHFGQSSP